MGTETVHLLLVEDNPVDALALKEALEEAKGARFAISHVQTLAEAKERVAHEDFQVVVLDLGLPDSQGLETFVEVRAYAVATPIVVLSGLDDEALAIETLRKGAQDYLIKDRWDRHILSRAINYAIERHRLLTKIWGLKTQSESDAGLEAHFGKSRWSAQIEPASPKTRRHLLERSDLSSHEMGQLIHELQVHQILLEMQNEELRQAQVKLEELKDNYLDLYDFAPVGYVTLNDKGLILEANLTAVRLLGQDRQGLIERPFSRFVCRECEDAYYLHLQQVFQTKSKQACELELCRDDGTHFHVRMESVAIQDESGQLGRCRTTVSDITERKQAEEALGKAHAELERRVEERTRQLWKANVQLKKEITERKRAEDELQRALAIAEKLRGDAEAANRAKSEFLANMSHELRTPLNGIMGNIELSLNARLTEEQQRYLRGVEASSNSLLGLIDDILDLSKIEAGKFDLDRTEFNLRDCIAESVGVVSVRAHAKGIELICHVPPSLPKTMVGDPRRLGQIIRNLIGNAAKFTETGEIVLRVEAEEESGDEIHLHFSVTDTGIGIAAEAQEKIFDIFEQVDASTTRKYGGTGLGLAISSRLVRMMEGRIWVQSEVGIGSTFHFVVRLAVRREPEFRDVEEDLTRVHGLSALIVDDNVTARSLVRDVLISWGMNPTAVSSARDTLAAMERACQNGQTFDFLLVDEIMPGIDGHGLVEALKERSYLDSLPIIMLTSPGASGEVSWRTSLGVAEYVTKPVKESDLLAAATRITQPDMGSSTPDLGEHVHGGNRRLNILLAEDNAINREMVVAMLETMGHGVVVAENGREALYAFEKQKFDLILMDIQMPGTDGVEATKFIRQLEEDSEERVPIVALTAHAMKGDREKFLACGMDAYLSKPVGSKHLAEIINSLVPGKVISEAMVVSLCNEEVLDGNELLDRVTGDHDILREIVHLFLEENPKRLFALRGAIANGDAGLIARTAHKVKGSAGALGGHRAMNAAHRLETLGKSGDLTDAQEACQQLELELDRLETALVSFMGQGDQ